MRRALYYKSNNRFLDAHNEALRATHNHPDHLPAWQLRAEMEFILGRYQTCISTCSEEAGPCSSDLSDWKPKCDTALELISKPNPWAKPDAWANKHSGDLQNNCPALAALDELDSKSRGRLGYSLLCDFAKFLTEPFVTEAEKHRVIFTWMVQNFSYDFEQIKEYGGIYRTTQLNTWQYLKQRSGVCKNYTDVYHDLANAAGLIGGGSMNSMQGLGAHAWNTVVIDGQRYPQDVTWGLWCLTCSDTLQHSNCHLSVEFWRSKPIQPNTDYYKATHDHYYDDGIGVFESDYSWPSGHDVGLDAMKLPECLTPDSTICCVSGTPKNRAKGFCRICMSSLPQGCFRNDNCIQKHYMETVYSKFYALGYPLSGATPEEDPLMIPIERIRTKPSAEFPVLRGLHT